jgi:hypothetical protein
MKKTEGRKSRATVPLNIRKYANAMRKINKLFTKDLVIEERKLKWVCVRMSCSSWGLLKL